MDEILTALDGVVDGLHERAGAVVTGRADFWPGPLDVQGLATSSVGLAAASAQEFARATGRETFHIGARLPEVVAAFGSITHLRIDGRPVPGFAPASGFFPTADGWLRTHANYPHHRSRLFRALRIDDDDALPGALARLTSRDAEARVVAAEGVAAAVVDEETWRRGATSAPGPWLAISPGDVDVTGGPRAARPAAGPWAATSAPDAAESPLNGVRVVSLTRVIAGPTGAKFLAALGADVLRIDPPVMPESTGQHLDTDLGVRCAARDLSDPRQAAELTEVLAGADVLFTGYRPGSLTALGLDAATVRERFPHLVHVELSAWESAGPRGGRRGFDSIVQAASGIAVRCGRTGDDGVWRPGALPVQALDHATGYGMAAAACALLAAGTAGHAHLSLERTARVLLGTPVPSTHRGSEDAVGEAQTVLLRTGEGTVRCVPSPVRVDGRRPPVHPPLTW